MFANIPNGNCQVVKQSPAAEGAGSFSYLKRFLQLDFDNDLSI